MADSKLLPTVSLDVEAAVRERYTQGAQECTSDLCCPVDYDTDLLKILPAEVIERDYGCGDPSRHLQQGETVLDLGSGGGKICFIAAQVVGPQGKVIGVDMNLEMLDLARRNAPVVADRLGYANTQFHRGKIQDLSLDLDRFDAYLREQPIASAEDYQRAEAYARKLADEEPMIATGSVDVVVSNCVLNLVRPQDKEQLFREIFRVLRKGGRAIISDIVCDEPVPMHLQNDPELWSGCFSGAFEEEAFLAAFEAAGFHGIRILDRTTEPRATIEGIEFRSATVEAFTGTQGICLERNQAVIYAGPWKEVKDDDGHVMRRGEHTAVCDKTYHLLQKEPYRSSILPVPPRGAIPLEEAEVFDCSRSHQRHPRETKGVEYNETKGCAPGESCC
jgi:SAM-dependent methyltransferase